MYENVDKTKQKSRILETWILGILLVFVWVIYFILSAPSGNKDILIHVSSGESFATLSKELIDKNAIRNDFTLKVFFKLLESNKGIISGDYLIKKNSPIWIVAWQVARGHHNIEPIKITIREGLTNDQIALLFSNKLTSFDKDLFLVSIPKKQGYLFPDTYFFYPLDTTNEIIERLSNNFYNRIKNLNSVIKSSGKSLNEIIIMASILEGEAAGKDDVAIISGILWKRISQGMLLQVDIARSTYNTKGLPDAPLNNPGLSTINAAIKPVDSPYLYYLHDKNGKVHYAVTYDEHRRNINNYLK